VRSTNNSIQFYTYLRAEFNSHGPFTESEGKRKDKTSKKPNKIDDNNNNNNTYNNNNNNNNTEQGNLYILDNNKSSVSAITPTIMR
jgi:hypothetical protein